MAKFPSATILGYPRIGHNRELKRLEEAYWLGKTQKKEFLQDTKELRIQTYKHLRDLGLSEDFSIPQSFSYYDQVLDASCLFNIVPKRFQHLAAGLTIDDYFTIARGDTSLGENGLPAEMTKWFDTNYHYIVPEFTPETKIAINFNQVTQQFLEAKEAGFLVRPVIVGPVTLLALAKFENVTPYDFIDDLATAYAELLGDLCKNGARWVQFDEPALFAETLHLSTDELFEIADKLYRKIYTLKHDNPDKPQVFVTTPYACAGKYAERLTHLPVEALHYDFTECGTKVLENVDASHKVLVAGLINGRNIWRMNDDAIQEKLNVLQKHIPPYWLRISTSTSLQHVPHTLDAETELTDELKSNLSFADEKIAEVLALSGVVGQNRAPKQELKGRKVTEVSERLANIKDTDFERESVTERKNAQHKVLNLSLLPTTTIGSFPQTSDIRVTRSSYKKQEITEAEYTSAMQAKIKECIDLQEEIGLDVMVHGEAERNDMVQYFAENFEGFAVTKNGWVQSYGSRSTKPSILWGDVWRKKAFTVPWITYADSLTEKPVKGMLTGPVTILAWSFVRDDQPKGVTANQVALALRDEIADLETAGIKIIQIDEPALRELLPLKLKDQKAYIDWSVASFRLATSGVKKETQIHTHLCYSEFEVILPAIIGLNADVTSIEAARSKMEIVAQLVDAKYPTGIGPGIYDIHSPRIPSKDELKALLLKAVKDFKDGNMDLTNLWVNPDCGLKTRRNEESTPSLVNMVQATLEVRNML
ncbi:MAG: 5-methyltetrahydropteroyltriglutamate--homocysteine S-methyltransferase [Bifidobacteriaceae bacterium]|jgi:5-methyltetrahydropteroyltriglutamate--homocysteine methyltransferase|nr:5-methyltetrahydropteroyltriglutamate--homocysteine S-methyltransferase [Bifidobacteriaceae bacterium]